MTATRDPDTPAACHVCGRNALAEISAYAALARMTSDCKPWPAGGRLGVCAVCAVAQAPATETWRREIAEIYRQYTIYYQGEGAEQAVFDPATGQSHPRSTQISHRLRAARTWPAAGRLLDIGCGNGQFLRRFHEYFSDWSLAGTEWDGKYRKQVESLPGVERLYVGKLAEVPGAFDLISLIHVLEHIENPVAFLADARGHLSNNGLLFIEVPHFLDNPFELLITDHASHFTVESLRRVVEAAGFEVQIATTEWVPKEISLFARKAGEPRALAPAADAATAFTAANDAIRWLGNVSRQAAEIAAKSKNFGVFGTSIAGTWLGGGLGHKIAFFVDEDPSRSGKSHLGKPIFTPAAVPASSDVFVGLAPLISGKIAKRLARSGVNYHVVK